MLNMEIFAAEYARQLLAHALRVDPKTLSERPMSRHAYSLTQKIAAGSMSIDTPIIHATCVALGIKHDALELEIYLNKGAR